VLEVRASVRVEKCPMLLTCNGAAAHESAGGVGSHPMLPTIPGDRPPATCPNRMIDLKQGRFRSSRWGDEVASAPLAGNLG